jgi:NDP-sugar pyrophosphorylase family protein
MEDVTIQGQGYISDSVVGESSHIHAATKLISGEGAMKMPQGDLVESHFGAIMGSNVIVGPGSTLSHAVIGNGADIGIGRHLSSTIIADQMQVR